MPLHYSRKRALELGGDSVSPTSELPQRKKVKKALATKKAKTSKKMATTTEGTSKTVTIPPEEASNKRVSKKRLMMDL